MNISPVYVAGVVLAGGLATGGYFAYQAVTPSTLEEHFNNNLKLKLINDIANWTEKVKSYKLDVSNQINGIDISKGDNEIATALQKWCNKKKSAYFLSNSDDIYKRFSLWCSVTQNIDSVLKARGLNLLNGETLTKKFEEYGNLEETAKFLAKKEKLVEQDLISWCNEKNKANYKYEGEPELEKLINWCYFK